MVNNDSSQEDDQDSEIEIIYYRHNDAEVFGQEE